MSAPCPECGTGVTIFYRLSQESVIVICDNLNCEMAKLQIEGSGDKTQEAIEHFTGQHAIKDRKKNKQRRQTKTF